MNGYGVLSTFATKCLLKEGNFGPSSEDRAAISDAFQNTIAHSRWMNSLPGLPPALSLMSRCLEKAAQDADEGLHQENFIFGCNNAYPRVEKYLSGQERPGSSFWNRRHVLRENLSDLLTYLTLTQFVMDLSWTQFPVALDGPHRRLTITGGMPVHLMIGGKTPLTPIDVDFSDDRPL